MLNQVVFIGRLTGNPKMKELENGKKVSSITVAVQKAYKNADGVYDTDFIDCSLWNGLATNTVEYCKKGDLIGIKGHLSTNKDKNGKSFIEIIPEKITFLSARKDIKEDTIEEDIDKDSISI